MKLSVVGCEASGKTVFLSGLADFYRPGSPEGLCLVPENAAANRFARMQERQMRVLRQWPPATNPENAAAFSWSLRRGSDLIASVDMLEFGGETFRAAFRDTANAVARTNAEKTLLDHLGASDAVIVLVSIKELLRNPGLVPMETFERDTESIWVTHGLLSFVRKNIPDAKVAVGLTQADRYRKELAEAQGARALLAAHWPTVAAAAADIPVVEIASVSATDEHGNPAEGYTTEGVQPAVNAVITPILQAAKHKRAARPNSNRRTVLLFLLLLATALLALTYKSIIPAKQITAAKHQPPRQETKSDQKPQETVPAEEPKTEETVPTEEPKTEEPKAEEPVPAEEPKAEEPVPKEEPKTELPVPKEEDGYRIWEDHRGVRIKARWLETAEDGKRITLETASGRIINAVVWKFSTNDQEYIKTELNRRINELPQASAKTNATDIATDGVTSAVSP